MSKRRSADYRPVEKYATDRVEFEQLNDRLRIALSGLPDAVATALGGLLSGGYGQAIEQVLLEYAQQHGPDAEQPALDLFSTGVLVDDLHELARRIDEAQNLEPADIDRLIRHIDWIRLHPIRSYPHEGVLVQCPTHGWSIDPDLPPLGGTRIQVCRGCPCPVPARDTGRPGKFCSSYCRVRAHRARKRGGDGRAKPVSVRPLGRTDDPVQG